MRTLRSRGRPGLLAVPLLLGVLAAPAVCQAPDAKVTLQLVKYEGLTQTLDGLKGKVIVMDCWADF